MYTLNHRINGEATAGTSGRTGPVFNPATGEQVATVALANKADVDAAVAAAQAALPAWSAMPPLRRARVMFRFNELILKNEEQLAEMITTEHGKTIEDAKGDILRGREVVEFACGIPHLLRGDFTEDVGTGVDAYTIRQPVGVCAGITPFNFPAMIPLWMFPLSIACGNTFILKPSEKDPSVPMRLAELMLEAGAPPGVLNVVNGDKESVDAILEDQRIQAVSFVGSTPIAHYVYKKAAEAGKRCQAMGGAKNHMIVMPDADMDQASDALIGSAYGSAGERCMAISVAVPVGQEAAEALMASLRPKVETLKVGPSTDPDAHFGPLVTAEHREKVLSYVNLGIEEGADLVVDGRDFRMQGYESGYFMGGCLFDNVKPDMRIYKEEIFGPVLSVVRANDFDEALALPSDHEFGNGVSIFTHNGDAARDFARRVQVGMVGVNVPIPVPLSFHTFGGWKNSAFGDTNQHGPEGVKFYTKIKTVTSRWPGGNKIGPDFTIPTVKA